MDNFILENYLTDLTICDDLIEWFYDNSEFHQPGKLYLTAEGEGQLGVDTQRKASTDFCFTPDDEIAKGNNSRALIKYLDELHIILERYLQAYSFANNVSLFSLTLANIQHYKPYEGFKIYHCERSGPGTSLRHLVFQTYLNTVDDGGGTEFFYQGYKCKAVKGKTVMWPVDWTHTHRGEVSPTQEKYLLTGWFSFGGLENNNTLI